MAGNLVITWDNDGKRVEHRVSDERAGLVLAKTFRTMSFRTVKVADVHGSTHHWIRSLGLKRNHWSVRAVASDAFS